MGSAQIERLKKPGAASAGVSETLRGGDGDAIALPH